MAVDWRRGLTTALAAAWWLLACLAGPTTAVAAGRADPPGPVKDAVAPTRNAFILGIDRFEDPAFDTLRFAEADARAIRDRFDHLNFESTTVITTEGPSSRAGILAELDSFLAARGPDDTVVVYLSTHGVVDYVGGPPRRYLVARDTRRDDLRSTGLDVRELIRRVEAAPPRWKVIVLASCFGGTGEGVHSAEGPMPDHQRGKPDLPPLPPASRRATVVLSASYADGPAWEDPELGHEIYTYYLLEALADPTADEMDLDGDGVLSAFEAHGYAARRTIEHTAGRQLPSADLNAVGERDVLLSKDESDEARRGVFWILPDWLQMRGDGAIQAWIDGEAVNRRSSGHVLAPGSHSLRLHWPDGSQPDRKLGFRVGKGDDLSVSDVLARADDQWLGVEIGTTFVSGGHVFNRMNDDEADPTDDPHDVPVASPAIRLVFEQRLAGREQPRRLILGMGLSFWPGPTYDHPLGRVPARRAGLDVGLAAERRIGRVAVGAGAFGELFYLRAAGSEASALAFSPGLRVRVHVRLGRRLSLRVGAQLGLARMDPFTNEPDPTYVLLPGLTAGLGMEL